MLDTLSGLTRRFARAGGIPWVATLAIVVATAAHSPGFRTWANASDLSRATVVLALAALGQFIIVLGGGVDLSVGMNVRVGGIVAASVMVGQNGNIVFGLLVALGIGAAIGLINGLLVTRLGIEPFIATLGMFALARGISLYLSKRLNGNVAPGLSEFYGWKIGPVYGLVVITAIAWLVAAWMLYRTPWGVHVHAIGADPAVANLGGINVRRMRTVLFVIAGAIGGLATIASLSSGAGGSSTSAEGLEFEALAAVVVGGVSLAGGRGRLLGALGGVVLLSVLDNALTLLRVEAYYQQLVRGLVILIAAGLYVESRSRRSRKPRGEAIPSTTA